MAKKSKKTMEDDWWNFGETMKQEVMTGDMSKDMTYMSSLITSIFFNMFALKLDWYMDFCWDVQALHVHV